MSSGFTNTGNAQVDADAAIAESWLSPADQGIILAGNYNTLNGLSQMTNDQPPNTNGYTLPCAYQRGKRYAPDFTVSAANSSGKPQTDDQIIGTVLHELGHAIDDMIGETVGSPFFSSSLTAQGDIGQDYAGMGSSEQNFYLGPNSQLLTTSEITADIFEAELLAANGLGDQQIGNTRGATADQLLNDFSHLKGDFDSAKQQAEKDYNDGLFNGQNGANQRSCPDPNHSGPSGGNPSSASHEIGPAGNLMQAGQVEAVCPLIIELSNDTVHTTTLNNGNYFDMENTGFQHMTAWVGANDGFLVLNNNNGNIASGAQLFGTSMALANGTLASNGFAALAQYDVNHAGHIDSSDPIWSQLGVLMGDGRLLTLDQIGITAINLGYGTVNSYDVNGNKETAASTFVYSSGQTGTVADFNLREDTVDSSVTNPVQLSPTIAALPDATGYGIVQDLQQAMQLDTTGTLQNLVTQFVATNDPSTQNSLLDQIIFNWTGVTGVAANAFGPDINGQVAAALQKFNGANFTFSSEFGPNTQPNATQGYYYTEIYSQLKASIYGELEFSGAINDLSSAMENGAAIDPNTGAYTYDLSEVANSLIQQDQTDHNDAQTRLAEFVNTLEGFQLIPSTNFQQFENDFATAAPDLMSAFAVNPLQTFSNDHQTIDRSGISTDAVITLNGSYDTLTLGFGNVTVNAYGSNEIIQGGFLGADTVNLLGGGNNYVGAGGGADVVSSWTPDMFYNVLAAGNDVLAGGLGNDTYYLTNGFGNATITEGSFNVNDMPVDIVTFGNGINESSLTATANGRNLILTFDANDILTLNDTLTNGPNMKLFSDFQFADGTNDTIQQLLPNPVPLLVSAGGGYDFTNSPVALDDISITGSNATIEFGANAITNDVVVTGSRDNITFAVGDPAIVTDSGNSNVFNFNSGNDSIVESGSNDTMSGVFGNDSVVDHGTNNTINVTATGRGTITAGSNDTISGTPTEVVLGAGSTQSNAAYSANGIQGLNISWPGVGDNVAFTNILASASGGNELIEFSDGSTQTLNQLLQGKSLTVTNTANNANISRLGSSANETINSSGSSDSIHAGSGNDTITDTGNNNRIYEGTGNDTITVGGSDNVYDGAGLDNLYINSGSGITTIYNPSNTTWTTNDTINFGTGITASSLSLSSNVGWNGNNAVLNFGISGDQIDVLNGYTGQYKPVNLVFANGTSESLASVLQAGVTLINNVSNSDSVIDYSTTVANEHITNTGWNDVIHIGSGNNTFNDKGQNNLIDILGQGTDQVALGSNETVSGALGNYSFVVANNDQIQAGAGSDTYTYNSTAGAVIISEGNTPNSGASDTLSFGQTISENEIAFTQSGSELILTTNDGNPNDKVYLIGELNQSGGKIVNAFQFADGTSWTLAQLLAQQTTITSSNSSFNYSNNNGNETIANTGVNNNIVLGNGNVSFIDNGSNDTVTGGAGNDQIAGGANDTLNAGSGNDSFVVANNDQIYSGAGVDSYIYNKGTGTTTIYEGQTPNVSGTSDILNFGSGISETSLATTVIGNELQLNINDGSANDVAYISNELNQTTGKMINAFRFADGTTWTLAQLLTAPNINSASNTSASYSNADGTIINSGTNDTITLSAGNDALTDNGQNNIINAGTGSDFITGAVNDTINAGSGNDVIVTANNDQILSGSGADSYVYNSGAGQTTIYEGQTAGVSGTSDTLNLGTGIFEGALTAVPVGNNDLQINLNDGNIGDSIYLANELNQTGTKVINSFQFSDGTTWTLAQLLAQPITINSNNSSLNYGSSNANENIINNGISNNVVLNNGNDTFIDNGHDNTITAGTGNDLITAAGNDILNGGSGNDIFTIATSDHIYSGTGTDSYTYAQGTGNVTIIEGQAPNVTGTSDTLTLGTGISENTLVASALGNDLQLTMNDGISDDSLYLSNELNQTTGKIINSFQFADGTTWTLAQLLAQPIVINSNNTTYNYSSSSANQKIINNGFNDTFTLSNGTDVFTDYGHNNTVNAGTGADQITGSANDFLKAGSGNDSFIVASNDQITAGAGIDTFIYNQDTGKVTINESETPSVSGTTDVLNLGTGISETNFYYTTPNNNLLLSFNDGAANDTITINNEFNQGSNKKIINSFNFADGTTLSLAQLLAEPITVSSNNSTLNYSDTNFNENITNTGSNDTFTLSTGNNTFTDVGHNDTINASNGNSVLINAGVNDTVNAGSGNDQIIGAANDTLKGGSGNDSFVAGPNDQITAGSGNDSFIVASNDQISGGGGIDTYTYNQGTGKTTINESQTPNVPGSSDVLNLGAAISETNFSYATASNNLVLTFNDGATNDILTINNEFNQGTRKVINSFNFADGTSWTLAQLLAEPITIAPANSTVSYNNTSFSENITNTGSNDNFTLSTGNDIFTDAGHNDTINVSNGNSALVYAGVNDTVNAGSGNDQIIGAANDTLKAGSGNDTFTTAYNDQITGGAGIDTFTYNQGTGRITINESETPNVAGTTDVLNLGTGISETNFSYATPNNNLVLTFNDGATNDIITINNELNQIGSKKIINSFDFADGTTLTLAQLLGEPITLTSNNSTLNYSSTNFNETITNTGFNDSITLSSGSDTLTDTGHNNTITPGTGNDVITAGVNDTINSSAGNYQVTAAANDTLRAGSGNDTFIAANNDQITSGAGLDSYVYNKGTGPLTINEGQTPTVGGTSDVLTFGAGISENSFSYSTPGNVLVLTFNDGVSNDTVTINSEFNQGTKKVINSFSFADGNTLTLAQLLAEPITITANNTSPNYNSTGFSETITNTGANDNISLSNGTDTFTDNGHNNTINPGTGNDVITAGINDTVSVSAGNYQVTGAANDTLKAGSGNDTFISANNDTMNAGVGVDTFVYNKGAGSLIINESQTPTVSGTIDTLDFGTGITEAAISAVPNGNTLQITINDGNTTDSITLNNELNQAGSKKVINDFQFSDGTNWTLSQLLAQPITNNTSNATISYTGSTLNETIINNGVNDTITLGNGNDVFTDNAHNDTINTGNGNDQIHGGANDTIKAGSGNDSVLVGTNDSITSGTGADSYTYNVGTGAATITEGKTPTISGTIDTLTFGAGISETLTKGYKVGNTLQINLNDGNANDVIQLATELNQTSTKVINSFQFADGTNWTLAQFLAADDPPGPPPKNQNIVVGGALNSLSTDNNSQSGTPSNSLSSSTSGTIATANSNSSADILTTESVNQILVLPAAKSTASLDPNNLGNIYPNVAQVDTTSGSDRPNGHSSYNLEKYELSTGKFLTGSDLSLVAQHMAAFVPIQHQGSVSSASESSIQNTLNTLVAVHH